MTTPTTARAVLAGGCFWGMQDLIRKVPGVISTRVGYSGGDVPNATYRRHGNHAGDIRDPGQRHHAQRARIRYRRCQPGNRGRADRCLHDRLLNPEQLADRRAHAQQPSWDSRWSGGSAGTSPGPIHVEPEFR